VLGNVVIKGRDFQPWNVLMRDRAREHIDNLGVITVGSLESSPNQEAMKGFD